MSIEGRVVVVTGAARGMGRSYVRAFCEKGDKVAAVDRSWVPSGRSGDRDDAFVHELEQHDDVLMLTCDITDDEQIQDAFNATIKAFGTVDCLVNNASVLQRDLFPPVGSVTVLETKDSDFERMFAVNVFGSLKVTRAFIKPMIEQQRGSIITASSPGGVTKPEPDGYSWTLNRPNSREQPYQASKSALTCLMGYLADEVKNDNVAVNVIYPSWAQTTGFEERNRAIAASSPSGSSRPGPGPARPEHIVPIALFLAEQEAKTGITGRLFNVMRWNQEHGFGGADFWEVTG